MSADFDDESGLPLTNRDQSCAFCGASGSRFVHPLDAQQVRFQIYGKGWTLPTFWTTCADCERLVEGREEDELLRRMAHEEDDLLVRQASLAAFWTADLGPLPLRVVSD